MLLHDVIDPLVYPQCGSAVIVCSDSGIVVGHDEFTKRVRLQSEKLCALGLGPGDRVAIIGQKSPEMIAAFVGAARIGVVYLPLDAKAAPAYWQQVLSDLDVSTVLTNMPGIADQLPGARVVDLMADGSGDPVRPQTTSLHPNDSAYILTTSGSTGRPKGVLLSHENALAFVNWAADEIQLNSHDVVLSVAPFHFDLSVLDIYGSLSRGARLVLAPKTAAVFVGELMAVLERNSVSVLYTVPTVLCSLLDAGAFEAGKSSSLRVIIYAGEPFPAPALARLMTALPNVVFFNFFGPTETNVSLAHRFSEAVDPSQEIPIGRPASGAQVRLVDDSGCTVRGGEIGEIVIDGPTVMKGYLTEGGFNAAARPYATGDFACVGDDGNYYFRGRRDQQVKIRGMRIELSAVETTLMSMDGVQEAAAMLVDNELVGFVAGKKLVQVAALRRHCKDLLSAGSVPHRFVALDVLPRLSNGKLDLVTLKSHCREHKHEQAIVAQDG